MSDLRAFFLDPSKSFLECSFNFPFHAVNFILGYPFLPLCFWIVESPWLFIPLSWICWPSSTGTVAFPAHHYIHPSIAVVGWMTRPVSLHVGSHLLRLGVVNLGLEFLGWIENEAWKRVCAMFWYWKSGLCLKSGMVLSVLLLNK